MPCTQNSIQSGSGRCPIQREPAQHPQVVVGGRAARACCGSPGSGAAVINFRSVVSESAKMCRSTSCGSVRRPGSAPAPSRRTTSRKARRLSGGSGAAHGGELAPRARVAAGELAAPGVEVDRPGHVPLAVDDHRERTADGSSELEHEQSFFPPPRARARSSLLDTRPPSPKRVAVRRRCRRALCSPSSSLLTPPRAAPTLARRRTTAFATTWAPTRTPQSAPLIPTARIAGRVARRLDGRDQYGRRGRRAMRSTRRTDHRRPDAEPASPVRSKS